MEKPPKIPELGETVQGMKTSQPNPKRAWKCENFGFFGIEFTCEICESMIFQLRMINFRSWSDNFGWAASLMISVTKFAVETTLADSGSTSGLSLSWAFDEMTLSWQLSYRLQFLRLFLDLSHFKSSYVLKWRPLFDLPPKAIVWIDALWQIRSHDVDKKALTEK